MENSTNGFEQKTTFKNDIYKGVPEAYMIVMKQYFSI